MAPIPRKNIGAVNLDFTSTNQIGTITVTFSYRYWENYAIDNFGQIHGRGGKASTSLGQNDVTQEETSSGFLGGIMRKLNAYIKTTSTKSCSTSFNS